MPAQAQLVNVHRLTDSPVGQSQIASMVERTVSRRLMPRAITLSSHGDRDTQLPRLTFTS